MLPNSIYEQDGVTPLYVASCYGHTEVVRTLLNNGADATLASAVRGLSCASCTSRGG